MFCKCCGKELASTTELCPFCNTEVNKGSDKVKDNKKLLTIIASVLTLSLILAAIIIVKGFGIPFEKNDQNGKTEATAVSTSGETEPSSNAGISDEATDTCKQIPIE